MWCKGSRKQQSRHGKQSRPFLHSKAARPRVQTQRRLFRDLLNLPLQNQVRLETTLRRKETGTQYRRLVGRHHCDTQAFILRRPDTGQPHRHTASLLNQDAQERDSHGREGSEMLLQDYALVTACLLECSTECVFGGT